MNQNSVLSDSQLRQCQVLLAAWHFTATAILLFTATLPLFQVFQAVRLPIVRVLPISAFFTGFLLLGNLSLAYNPVGFYQLAKTMTTPTVVLLNFLLFRKTVSCQILASVVAVCFGVVLTNSQLAFSNQMGSIIATASFTVTALYQIWIGKMIVDFNVSAPQLLLNQAVVSVPILLAIAPFFDVVPDLSKSLSFPNLRLNEQTNTVIKTGRISPGVAWAIVGSGVVASLLNLSQFLIIGRTSALTVCVTLVSCSNSHQP